MRPHARTRLFFLTPSAEMVMPASLRFFVMFDGLNSHLRLTRKHCGPHHVGFLSKTCALRTVIALMLSPLEGPWSRPYIVAHVREGHPEPRAFSPRDHRGLGRAREPFFIRPHWNGAPSQELLVIGRDHHTGELVAADFSPRY